METGLHGNEWVTRYGRASAGGELNGLVATVIAKTPDKAGSVRATAALVLHLGFLQNGGVGVGVFPDLKEVLVPPLALAVSPVIA